MVAYEWIHADITHKCSFHLLYMKITDYLKEIKQFVDCSCLFKFIYTDYYIQSFFSLNQQFDDFTKMQKTKNIFQSFRLEFTVPENINELF